MRAVTAPEPGGPEALIVTELPDPEAGPGEVVIDVVASAVNRADTLQRQGFYPPPKGASDVLGLECSGRISAVGEGVEGHAVGDEVCALLASGGYAEKVAVPAGQVMPLPAGRGRQDRGRLPGGGLHRLVQRVHDRQPAARRDPARARRRGRHRELRDPAGQGSSARGSSRRPVRPEKLELCESLGADRAINYHDEDFVEVLKEAGGADVILDNMGAQYLSRNVSALATEGRLVVIGMQGGTKGELDLGMLLGKRGAVIATSLRSRPAEEKAAICASVVEHVWPLIGEGKVRTLVHEEVPFEQASRGPRADGVGIAQRQDPARRR